MNLVFVRFIRQTHLRDAEKRLDWLAQFHIQITEIGFGFAIVALIDIVEQFGNR